MSFKTFLSYILESDPQVPVLRVRSFKLRQEEWYGSLPGHTVRNHRSVSLFNLRYFSNTQIWEIFC